MSRDEKNNPKNGAPVKKQSRIEDSVGSLQRQDTNYVHASVNLMSIIGDVLSFSRDLVSKGISSLKTAYQLYGMTPELALGRIGKLQEEQVKLSAGSPRIEQISAEILILNERVKEGKYPQKTQAFFQDPGDPNREQVKQSKAIALDPANVPKGFTVSDSTRGD